MITPFSYMRIAMIYSSTALSLIILMLVLNIITIDEVLTIVGLDLKSNEAQALKLVISRIQEMSTNILQIISMILLMGQNQGKLEFLMIIMLKE